LGDGDLGIGSTAHSTMSDPAGIVESMSVTHSGSTGTLTVTPGAGKHGTAALRVTASDTYNGVAQSMFDDVLLTVVPRPDLTVAKTHTGPWRQGDAGRTYTISVQNQGAGATLMPGDMLLPEATKVTVVDTLPMGLTYQGFAGTNWTCSTAGQTVTCENSESLAAGASALPLTLTVNVADDAAAQVSNTVTVSGGGDNTPGNNTATDVTNITQTADLTIAKSHTDPFRQGETGRTYTLTVSNTGPGPTDAPFTVTDTLPAGVTFVAGTGDGWACAAAGQTATCVSTAVVAAGADFPVITLDVMVADDAAPSLTNTATVSGGGQIWADGQDTSAITHAVIGAPNLAITKGHTDPWTQGDTGKTFSISVTNQGPDGRCHYHDRHAPGGPDLRERLRHRLGLHHSRQEVICTSDMVMAAGSTSTILLTVDVAMNAPPAVTNTATVSVGTELATTLADNTAADVVSVTQLSDLTIAKSHADPFYQGQPDAAYTLVVANAGTGETNGIVTVTDTLPNGLLPTGWSGGADWACAIAGQTVVCSTVEGLLPGESLDPITINIAVDRHAAAATGQVTNTATVAGGGEAVGNTGNNTAGDITNITLKPDLTLAKEAAGPHRQGQSVQYWLTVTNEGHGDTTGTITVTDTLPAGLSFVSGTGTDWTCSAAGQTVTCERTAALAPGANTTITLDVAVALDAPVSVTNEASVAGGGEPDVSTDNNTAADTASVVQIADLAVTKVLDGDSLRQGQLAVIYTLTVSNVGPGPTEGAVTLTDQLPEATVTRVADLTLTKTHRGPFVKGQDREYTIFVQNVGQGPTDAEVMVLDLLPEGLTANRMKGKGWICDLSDPGRPFCTRPGTGADALAPGDSYPEITLSVAVAKDAPQEVVNEARVSGGGQTNLTNDTALDPTRVVGAVEALLALAVAVLFTLFGI
ncbi:MAG TPA: hypothetical protein VD973_13985, partial [Symbiobacteriaceae bacterium]|nr:hypothetical protein [Symbiobacteriaceae bacterium]